VVRRVELVRSRVNGKELDALRQPDIGWGWQEGTGREPLAVPEGRVAFFCKGPKYTAALARTPEGHEKVWLFAPDGKRLGLAADYGAEDLHVSRMGWNAEGTVLGVVTTTQEYPEIGTWRSIDLVAADTRVRRHLTGLDFDLWGHIGWLGEDLLIWGVMPWRALLILEVDGTTGAKHVLHRQFLWPENCRIQEVVARPKGRYIAVNVGHHEENAWYELWILDRETGWFGRATYEKGMNDHYVVRWESEDRLLFVRLDRTRHQTELWRAYLQPTPEAKRGRY
jgi:hypothetical protein